MAKPKLALIPSTQGTKLYSVLPANGVGDFAFTRGSSATRINSQGLIETVASGVSRLNYPLIDGVVNGCPSHLLEPLRLQLIQYSEDFTQGWIKTRSTVTSNNLISPDGTLNADKFSETNETGLHALSKAETVTSGSVYTFSTFIKKGSSNFIQILFGTDNVTGNPYVNFDVNNGVVQNNGVTSADVKNYGNGWFRCSATITTATTSMTTFVSKIQSISDGRASSFAGDVNEYVYIWGAQLEQGSFPTSYIPNYGTALGVTRVAETANGAGDASTFNDSEGVLMFEGSSIANDGTYKVVSLRGTSNNILNVGYSSNSNNIYFYKEVNGVSHSPVLPQSAVNVLNFNKVAVSYSESINYLWINGFKTVSSTGVGAFTNLSTLNLDSAGATPFYGNTKQIQYFDSALNDTELETLTSWVSFSDMANSQLYSIE